MASRPTLGLALSAGGARGRAHIGVLKVLEGEGTTIDILTGSSMGGVIAAGYAAGFDADYLEAEALRMSQLRNLLALVDRSLPGLGLVEGKRIEEYLASQLGEITFDELRIPLGLVAVDLKTGREVVLRQSRVVDAVRATISMPGVLAPVWLDDQILVDGGVLNALPADVARQMGAEVVIAVDVSLGLEALPPLPEKPAEGLPLTQIPLIVNALRRTVGIMEWQMSAPKLAAAKPDALIQPQMDEEITTFGGFHRARECIAAGEAATIAALPVIKEALRPRL